MHTSHALHFALGGEALVEAFLTELLGHFRPGRKALLPARNASGFGLAVVPCQVGAYAHHRLDGHGLRDHEVLLAPDGLAEHGARRLEEVADDAVIARHFLRAAAGELDRAPATAHPAVQLVEKLGLQHPLVALTAAAEAVDAVAQRAVAFAVQLLDQARGELAVRCGERHAIVEIDEVALVDARRRGADDDEHLGGEVFAARIEDDAGHVDRRGIVRPLLHVEVQRSQAVLPVDDQVLRARLRDRAGRATVARAEIEALGSKEQHRSRDRRLRDGGLVEILELLHLGARERALEGLVVALDLGDELRDVVVLRNPRGRDLLALPVEAANETHLRHQVLGPVADEVKDAVLLADLRRLHGRSSVPRPTGLVYGREYKGKPAGEPGPFKSLAGAGPEQERLQHFGSALILDERDHTRVADLGLWQE